MSSQTVPFGPFRFCTINDLNRVRLDFVAKADTFNAGLGSASINGQSFQFSYGGVDYSREEFGDQLAAAYNSLGEDKYGVPGSNSALSQF